MGLVLQTCHHFYWFLLSFFQLFKFLLQCRIKTEPRALVEVLPVLKDIYTYLMNAMI